MRSAVPPSARWELVEQPINLVERSHRIPFGVRCRPLQTRGGRMRINDCGRRRFMGLLAGVADLISGHIPMLLQSVTAQAIEMHNAGKLRILAVTSTARMAAAPAIPTVGEAGFPGLASQGFIGLFAPKGTPGGIVDQIAQATRAAMADKALQHT